MTRGKCRRRTPAQTAATARNFLIYRLRALHAQVGMLSHGRADLARVLIDMELVSLGAEGETARAERLKAELLAKLEGGQ